MALVLYFTLKNAVVPGKGGHAEKREKAALLCWHRSSERGPTEGSGAGVGVFISVPLRSQGWLGKGLACQGRARLANLLSTSYLSKRPQDMGPSCLLTPCLRQSSTNTSSAVPQEKKSAG